MVMQCDLPVSLVVEAVPVLVLRLCWRNVERVNGFYLATMTKFFNTRYRYMLIRCPYENKLTIISFRETLFMKI